MSHQAPDPELKALENALKGLTPTPGGFDRDELFYRAGRESAPPPRRWLWPGTAAVMALALVAVASAWALRPLPQPEVRLVYVDVPVPAAPPQARPPVERTPEAPAAAPSPSDLEIARADADYLRVRDQVLRWGVDHLPPAPGMQRSSRAEPAESLWALPPALRRPLN